MQWGGGVIPRAVCPPRPLVLTGSCDVRTTLLSKHHVPDDDTLNPATHQSWLADIARADTTIDTPRHLFWGGIDPDADDSPTVDFTLLTRERDEPELGDESTEAVELAQVIPLRPEVNTDATPETSDLPVEAVEATGTEGADAEVLPGQTRGRRKLRRPVLMGAAALACVLTVLIGTSSAQSKHVALVIDGQTRYVDTRADTVTAVLASAGLNVGAHDSLAPAGSAAISDGSTIVLNHGQQSTVPVGGQAEQTGTTTTRADAVAPQAPAQAAGPVAGTTTAVAAVAAPAPARYTVSVGVGGAVATTTSTSATTVRALLAERKIIVGPLDVVTPGLATAIKAGQKITIDRVAQTKATAVAALGQPADTKVQDASLDQGTTTIAQQGNQGAQLVTYQVTTRNGVAVAKKEISRITTKAAQATVIHVGTKAPDPGSQGEAAVAAANFTYDGDEVFTHDTTFGVNWDGLANCESTHNPKAVNANPSAGLPTYGLFQFDIPTWESVGGSGNPMDASPSEQLMRAKLLYQQRGLEPWACAYAAQ